MAYNKVVDMAIYMGVVQDDLNNGILPKWVLKMIYGSKFVDNIEKAAILQNSPYYLIQLSELFKNE